ncbi:TRAP transporter TatT component family protein [candidate division KSB1 bacterium]|nr:TRAP transporter TatT component family protein [candidate division KSB1 bacterium]
MAKSTTIMKIKLIPWILAILFSACSMQKLTLRAMDPVIDGTMQALFEEADLELAKTAIESNLKLIEGMLRDHPKNQKLLFLLIQGYSAYALGFVEDEQPERAQKLYLRAREYGFRCLKQIKHLKFDERLPLAQFMQSLAQFSKDDVPALFWTANAWSNYINLNMGDPGALIDLPKVQAMMQRVLELDERYFFGGAHLFFGIIYSFKPVMLGGDPEKARQHFEACLEICDGKFLLPYTYYAKFYAVNTLDQDLFRRLLEKVQSTPIDILPEQRLPNAIAKMKAKKLMVLEADLF